MNIEIVKEEIIRRYKFIYKNVKWIIGPFKKERVDNEKKENLINKNIPEELLKLTWDFLLGDIICFDTELVKYVEKRKRDEKYVEVINQENDERNNEELLWELFNSLSIYILNQRINSKSKKKLIRALDEYYRILRYENNKTTITDGSEITNNLKMIKYINLFNKKNDNLIDGKFIDFVANKKNYNLNNQGILTEQDKLQVYLQFHDEIPWNTFVKCDVDNLSPYKPDRKRMLNSNKPCGDFFFVDEKMVFIDPEEKFYEYYHMCPYCGYIVTLPHSLLSDTVKTRIKNQCLQDEYHFRSMMLKAQLKRLDYRDDVLIKKRVK